MASVIKAYVLNWTAEAEQLRLRLLCAAKWLPEYDWPAVDNESLLATLERGCCHI